MLRFGPAAIAIGAAACGAAADVPLTHTAAHADCEILCRREATCSAADRVGDDCPDECAKELGGGGYRSLAIDDVTTCLDELDCSASMSRCFSECTPTHEHEKFETVCRAKVALCDGNGDMCETTPSPTNADIGFACMYTPAVMQALEGCLQRPCATLEECFGDVLAKSGLDHQTHLHP